MKTQEPKFLILQADLYYMLFNSFQFAVFFVIVYGMYRILPHYWQNKMLLVASYIFYGAWDWRFLFLILFSTVLDYVCAAVIFASSSAARRRMFLAFSVIGNLVVLGYFKYFDFFLASAKELLGSFGIAIHPHFLGIAIPVGISFYTFQTMSYTLDVYRGQMEPVDNFLDFALFVSFFPQLVAGPIERARNLLPQIIRPRSITSEDMRKGIFLILWGLFMKVVIADTLARMVDPVFASQPPYEGVKVLLVSYAFTMQIFCDFAGYSTIARGLGRVMGFEITVNFRVPFFVTNVRDFWDRWHISLSLWVRDYLYLPVFRALGNIRSNLRVYMAVIIAMAAIGLWHGAAWTYVLFGLYWGALFVVYLLIRSRCCNWFLSENVFLEKLWFWVRVIVMFHFVVFGMLIFRAQSIEQLSAMIGGFLSGFHIHDLPEVMEITRVMIIVALPLLFMQITEFRTQDECAVLRWGWWQKALFFFMILFCIVTFGSGGNEFIYFQF